MKRSAGILPFKIRNGRLMVYLGHFGGPFWAHKKRSWGVIKGEVEEGEEDLEAAKREFAEETGKVVEGEFLDLGEFKTSNKILHIFAIQKDLDTDIRSNMVQMEYKGRVLEFPEIDKVQWLDIQKAKELIVSSQLPILEALEATIENGSQKS